MLAERVQAFIRGEPGASFDELALAVCRLGCEGSEAWRELCEERGVRPAAVSDWREIPPLPMADDGKLAGADVGDGLLETVVDHSLPAVWLREMGGPPVLSLVPTGESPPDPVAALTTERLLRSRAAEDSVAMGRRGVEPARARGFLSARQRDRRPCLILATEPTLGRLLEALARRGLRFRLPPGSRALLLGRQDAAPPFEQLAEALAMPAEAVVREHPVAGIVTRLHAAHDPVGGPLPVRPPAWVRARVLDPTTLAEAPAGVEGSLAIFDLATLGAPAYRLTGDLAAPTGGGGFRLAREAPARPAEDDR